MNKEPRYHLFKDHVLDSWENKKIECQDMILGHECAYIVPERFISDEEKQRIWREPSQVQGVIDYGYTWISVKEKLPDDYQEVLYFCINLQGTKEIMTGHREKGLWMHCCWFYSSMRCDNTIQVTHWMPLPDYPK